MAPAISVYCRKRLARPRINYTKKEKNTKKTGHPQFKHTPGAVLPGGMQLEAG